MDADKKYFEWVRTSDATPEDGERVLIKRCCYSLSDYWEVATWNDHYNVWDDAEGDDYFCDKENVECWLRIKA